MRRFSYGLTADRGHVFDPGPGEFESEIRSLILNRAGYSSLPTSAPFVGHFPIGRDQYVILAKPSGARRYDGWILTAKQYAVYGYSPYRLLAEEKPEMDLSPKGPAVHRRSEGTYRLQSRSSGTDQAGAFQHALFRDALYPPRSFPFRDRLAS